MSLWSSFYVWLPPQENSADLFPTKGIKLPCMISWEWMPRWKACYNRVFWVIAKERKKYHKPTCRAYLAPFWTSTQYYMLFHLGGDADNRNRNVFDFFICLYTKFCFPEDSGSPTRGHNFIAHSSVVFSWPLGLRFFLGCFPRVSLASLLPP